MPDQAHPSPAAQLSAVLRVVLPTYYFEVHHGKVYAYAPTGYRESALDPDSRDDLARVVAMLTPKQRVMFGEHMNLLIEAARTHMDSQRPQPDEVVIAPASVWLDALEEAVK